MGVVFTTLFALGVVLISTQTSRAHIDVDCVLFGVLELAGTDTIMLWGWEIPRTMLTVGPALVVTLAWLVLFWKELKIVSFDPALATAMGISATAVHYSMMAMVAGVTVASFEAVGSILVVAMLIVPAATAHLLTDRLWLMTLLSAVVAIVAATLGYALAIVTNTNSAGMMAVVAGGLFALAVLLAPRHGLVTRLARQASLTVRIVAQDQLASLYRREESPAPGGALDETAGTSGAARWIARWWLARKGYIHYRPEGALALTDAGRLEAKGIVRSHRLWESFLGENFDLPKDHLHEAAHRMEHYIGPELRDEIAAELRDSHHDPHGRAIP